MSVRYMRNTLVLGKWHHRKEWILDWGLQTMQSLECRFLIFYWKPLSSNCALIKIVSILFTLTSFSSVSVWFFIWFISMEILFRSNDFFEFCLKYWYLFRYISSSFFFFFFLYISVQVLWYLLRSTRMFCFLPPHFVIFASNFRRSRLATTDFSPLRTFDEISKQLYPFDY